MRIALIVFILIHAAIFLGETIFLSIGLAETIVMGIALYNSVFLVILALFINKLLVMVYNTAYTRGRQAGYRSGQNKGFLEGKQVGEEQANELYRLKLEQHREEAFDLGYAAREEDEEVIYRLRNASTERWWHK